MQGRPWMTTGTPGTFPVRHVALVADSPIRFETQAQPGRVTALG